MRKSVRPLFFRLRVFGFRISFGLRISAFGFPIASVLDIGHWDFLRISVFGFRPSGQCATASLLVVAAEGFALGPVSGGADLPVLPVQPLWVLRPDLSSAAAGVTASWRGCSSRSSLRRS